MWHIEAKKIAREAKKREFLFSSTICRVHRDIGEIWEGHEDELCFQSRAHDSISRDVCQSVARFVLCYCP